ncbi:hypothetical protein K2224_02945 [Streptomyces sp. BHT-5-2]|uniref:hypothetical protein n=1 Tax=Streptomyces TaxID=1883 RepID=UPI001C8D570C|nr:hypothetical protein [Streptomyces sp. BHT-5-2]QZL02306.1 hypothetical protein K2224_02945 [Streptomyces sp. BHT-5-2]
MDERSTYDFERRFTNAYVSGDTKSANGETLAGTIWLCPSRRAEFRLNEGGSRSKFWGYYYFLANDLVHVFTTEGQGETDPGMGMETGSTVALKVCEKQYRLGIRQGRSKDDSFKVAEEILKKDGVSIPGCSCSLVASFDANDEADSLTTKEKFFNFPPGTVFSRVTAEEAAADAEAYETYPTTELGDNAAPD